jgi:single-strand DNA-binding protein
MSAIQTGVYRLGRDAETRYLPNGEPVCNLSLAYNWGKKDADGKQATTWIDAALWGKRAESAAPHLVKGLQIFVVLSDMHIETFNKADGTQGTKLAARVDSFDFIPGQRGSGEGQQQARGTQPAYPQGHQQQAPRQAAPAQRTAPKPAAAGSGFDDMDDDIPFITASTSYDTTTRKARKMARYDF